MYKYTYEDIANRYIDTVYRLALSRTKSPEYAEDITQDVFVKLWEKKDDFTDLNKVRSFLYMAVHNKAINELVHRKTIVEHADMLNRFTLDEVFHERVVEHETYRMMLEEIDRLPNQMREIMLRALEGKQNKEIAEELHISPDTVHSLKKIAYKKLRESMKDEYYLLMLLIILQNSL